MKFGRKAEFALILALFLSAGAAASWWYQSSVKYTDLTFYAWITNPTNASISQTSVAFDVYPNLPVNFNGTTPEGVNASFNVWPSGRYIVATIDVLSPGQTILIEDKGILISSSLESRQFNQPAPVFVTGYNSKLNVEYMSQIFANTIFGRLSAESAFTFQNVGQETDERTYTANYSLVSFESLALLGYGALLHARGRLVRGYPFFTMGFVFISSTIYSFVGSGREADKLSAMALYRNPLTSPVFHGYFQHITGNLPYFIIASVALEYWISKKTGHARYLWYLVPLAGALGGATVGWLQGTYSFGLSILIEFLAFALWTYAIANWKILATKRLNLILVLLAGLSMGVWYGWVYTLSLQVPFNAFNTPFDLAEAQGHVFAGIAGLLASLVYLGRDSIDKFTKKLKSRILRKTMPSP